MKISNAKTDADKIKERKQGSLIFTMKEFFERIPKSFWLILFSGIILLTIGVFCLVSRNSNIEKEPVSEEKKLIFDSGNYSDHMCEYNGCKNSSVYKVQWETENYYCYNHREYALERYRKIRQEINK